MFKSRKLFALLGILAVSLLGWGKTASARQKAITAINIALDPDATMTQRAKDANARLRKDYPKGFALDAFHHPHITLLQRYVPTENLDKIHSAIGKVLASERVGAWRLKATQYNSTPWKDKGTGIIVVEPTADVLKLQQKLIDALAPFTVKTGTDAAFFTTTEEPDIHPTTIDYVATFIPKQTGSNFHPHVTLGIASQDCLKTMIAEPFDAFTFSPAGISVYQLGNFGTARKKLKEWAAVP
jgi:2'-5' RNA ligase